MNSDVVSSREETRTNIEDCPDDVLIIIFKFLGLRERLQVALTCRRFHQLLGAPSGRSDDVAVVNIFQKRVWEANLKGKTKERVKSVFLSDLDGLVGLADHISQCHSLKLWFYDSTFVTRVLDVLRTRGLRAKCLDIYPYGKQLPLEEISRHYPDLEVLQVRTHGPDYFWTGMPMTSCPAFAGLDTLVLDSLTLGDEVTLPESVAQLDWSHRDSTTVGSFLDKLERCPNVKSLLIGHVQFEEESFLRLMHIIRNVLRKLVMLTFKFVKFPTIALDMDDNSLRATLVVVRFDLCYADMHHLVNEFIRICDKHLQMVQINTIFEENQLTSLYQLVPLLKRRSMWLQLGILQRNASTVPESVPAAAADLSDENGEELNENIPPARSELCPPLELIDILGKMEISFLDSSDLMRSILSVGNFTKLLELKFIQCKAVDDRLLQLVAMNCVRLKRILLNLCDQVTAEGMVQFLRHFDERRSTQLTIIWRDGSSSSEKTTSNIDNLQQQIMRSKLHLLRDKRMRCYNKCLPSEAAGSRLMIWETVKSPNLDRLKSLIVQDYSSNDLYWIKGFIVS